MKTYFNWSSGKDSALALYFLLQDKSVAVDTLFTTIGKETQRVSMHGLHRDVLLAQAASIGLPLKIMELPSETSMNTYNRLMHRQVQQLVKEGYQQAAFGDIFLEDLKQYREEQLEKVGLKALFPLWKRDTKELIHEFLALGFKSVIVAANAKWFNAEWVGQTLTEELLEQIPEAVDWCGENGEFHTFCYDGPIFSKPLPIKIGEKIIRSYPDPSNKQNEIKFWFSEIALQN